MMDAYFDMIARSGDCELEADEADDSRNAAALRKNTHCIPQIA